jgi:ArsR family transcriptional regulator, arsenate/arsenite/antimonite-responsive transcriptional repressor
MDDLQELEATADCLEALGNSTRLAIYRLLVKAGPEGLPVGAIQEALGVPASTLTHHLNRLVWVGLIEQRRQGRQLICSAVFGCLDQMLDFMVRECCRGSGWHPTARAEESPKGKRRRSAWR